MVSMAIASVLVVHPELTAPQLIRLVKDCADKAPDLPGLGTLNVECMLNRAGSMN